MKNFKLTFRNAFLLSLAMLIFVFGCKRGTPESSLSVPDEPSKSSRQEEPDFVWEVEKEYQIEKLDHGYERNSDTVAWLYIPGTTIDDAVLHRPGDNEFYLRLDEDKNYSVFGCYYADAYNTFGTIDELSKNTIIYGHSDLRDNPDGKKFSQLFKYLDENFLENNPNIFLSTSEEDMIFQVFAVFFTHIDFVYNWANPSKEVFENIIAEAKAKSEYIIDLDVKNGDKIVTLSTCTAFYVPGDQNNYRLVVMAKLVSDDMSQVKKKIEIAKNPNVQKP